MPIDIKTENNQFCIKMHFCWKVEKIFFTRSIYRIIPKMCFNVIRFVYATLGEGRG